MVKGQALGQVQGLVEGQGSVLSLVISGECQGPVECVKDWRPLRKVVWFLTSEVELERPTVSIETTVNVCW